MPSSGMHRDVIYTRQIQDNESLPRARVLEFKSIHHAQCIDSIFLPLSFIQITGKFLFVQHSMMLFGLLLPRHQETCKWDSKITSRDTTRIEGSHSDELIVLDNRKKAQNWKIKISLNFQSLKKIKHRYKHYYHQMLVNVL